MSASAMRLTNYAVITTCLLVVLTPGTVLAQSNAPPSPSSDPQAGGIAATTGRSDPTGKDAVAAASERYAAAEYEEALALLDNIKPDVADTPTRVAVEQYRALCLLALQRDDDAQQAIEQVVLLDPSYDVGTLNVSPSVKKRFLDVRARLLPGLARDEYEAGKAAFDRKAYAEAEPHLRKAAALSEAAVASGANDARTRDISTLAQGFLDLASSRAAPTETAGRSDQAAGGNPATERSSGGGTTSHAAAARTPVVVDPVPIKNDVPPISPQLRQLAVGRQGVIELTVDETGRVTRAVVRTSIYPVYDELLLRAARNWRYRPGTIDGKPTARTVTVTVRPE